MKDIIRLFRKGAVYSEVTGIIFRIAPVVYFASVLMAVMVIPLGKYKAVISFEGDFVFFACILALGKFFSIISALDTGSSFEGMGASREALFSLLVEPAFFVLMGSLALLTGFTSFHDIFMSFDFSSYFSYALGIMATFILVMMAMIENSRMPVDDPKTHLELTMIHEVMILDNSGFDLGLILHATNLKFAMYGALIANLYLGNLPWFITIPVFLMVQAVFAVTAGILESFSARFRMNHNPQFIFTLSSVSLLLFFGVLLILNKMI
jgi:formate hydrogenlyase subunit 4